MSITLGVPVLEPGDGRITYRVDVDGFPGPPSLWFSIPMEWSSLASSRADAALVALLMPAMAAGLDLAAEGPVTDELAWHLGAEAQEVLHDVRPEIARVAAEARHPMPSPDPAPGVATGYSAGVDSYTTLALHHFAADVPESLRLTHLIHNNVGSHGHGAEGRALFRKRVELLHPHARSMGLPLIDVDSNLDEFYLAVRLGFAQSHTIRNAAVAHLLSAGIGQYLYAASVPYDRVTARANTDLCFADPLLLPLLSTRSMTLRSSGSNLDRVAKTALIAEIPDTYERLNVCVASSDGTNCSDCSKCRRTMLTFELLGVLDRYRAVFRMPRNPNWREDFLVEGLTGYESSAARAVAVLYDERVGIPLRVRLRARARRLGGGVGRLARRTVRYAGRRLAGPRAPCSPDRTREPRG